MKLKQRILALFAFALVAAHVTPTWVPPAFQPVAVAQAAGLSETLEDAVIAWLFKQTAFPATSSVRGFSLHSADPGDTCANELATTNAYGRASLAADPGTDVNYNAQDNVSTTSRISNLLDITFPTASGGPWNGGTAITFYCVSDSLTVGAGTCLFCGSISGGGVTINDGNTLRFTGGSPGQMSFTID